METGKTTLLLELEDGRQDVALGLARLLRRLSLGGALTCTVGGCAMLGLDRLVGLRARRKRRRRSVSKRFFNGFFCGCIESAVRT